jgi:hypothetical protein
MNEIAYQWGRFAWWVYHANPEVVATVGSAIVSVIVTAILAVLTYYNVKATYRQASAMLQPALRIQTTFYDFVDDASGVSNTGSTESGKCSFQLVNLGDHPVVLLDVRGSAHPFARPSVVKQVGWLDEQILYPGFDNRRVVQFDFTNELSEEIRRKVGAGYEFRVVASDLSREISVTYVLHPVVGRITHYLRVPLRVRLKYKTLGIRRVYYHLKHGAMMWFNRFRKRI